MKINWYGTRALVSANFAGLHLFCEKIDKSCWRWEISNGETTIKSSSQIYYPKSRAEAIREVEHYLNLFIP